MQGRKGGHEAVPMSDAIEGNATCLCKSIEIWRVFNVTFSIFIQKCKILTIFFILVRGELQRSVFILIYVPLLRSFATCSVLVGLTNKTVWPSVSSLEVLKLVLPPSRCKLSILLSKSSCAYDAYNVQIFTSANLYSRILRFINILSHRKLMII